MEDAYQYHEVNSEQPEQSQNNDEPPKKKSKIKKILTMYDVSTKTIEDLCQLLQCQPQDIMDWEVELDPELSYERKLCEE